MRSLLEVRNVSRFFGEFQALHPVDFSIPAGDIVVLSGANGAGKSTLLGCISGLLRPSTGNILVEGFDLYKEEVAAKQRLAYVPDVPHFYQELTTWEHMQFICMAFRVGDVWRNQSECILKEFGLWESRDMYPHNLSRGMRLKLGISLALVRPCKVLLMDEPTSALDLESSNNLIKNLLTCRERGCAIMVTSHDPSLSESLGGMNWRLDKGILLMNA